MRVAEALNKTLVEINAVPRSEILTWIAYHRIRNEEEEEARREAEDSDPDSLLS